MPRSQEEMIVHTLCIALRLAFKYLYATRLAKVSVLSFTPTALNNTFMLYLKGGKKGTEMGASRRGREHRSSDIIHIIMGIVFSVISFFFFPLTRPSHGTIGGLSVQPNRPFLIIHRTLLCTRR